MIRLLLATMMLAAPAAAQTFPDRPIRIIVPLAPGGGTDVFARVLAELASPALGQPVVVENRPGAVGTIGMQAMLSAPADGHTIGFTVNSPITSAHHAVNVRYTLDQFDPLFIAAQGPFTLCVRPNSPFATAQDMIAFARANPERLTYGSDGVASTMHLAAERLFRRLDIRLTMVPFQGAAQTLTAFTGGHIDMYGGSIAPITPTARAGNARCLLVTSRDALADLPGAATLTQLGVPEEETLIWFAMVAPRGIPADRRARLLEAFRAAHATERFQNQVRSQGANSAWVGPEEFAARLRAEHTAFDTVARALNLRAN